VICNHTGQDLYFLGSAFESSGFLPECNRAMDDTLTANGTALVGNANEFFGDVFSQ